MMLKNIPYGWGIADETAMAKLRWAEHIFATAAPFLPYENQRDAYRRALLDLRAAIHSMTNADKQGHHDNDK